LIVDSATDVSTTKTSDAIRRVSLGCPTSDVDAVARIDLPEHGVCLGDLESEEIGGGLHFGGAKQAREEGFACLEGCDEDPVGEFSRRVANHHSGGVHDVADREVQFRDRRPGRQVGVCDEDRCGRDGACHPQHEERSRGGEADSDEGARVRLGDRDLAGADPGGHQRASTVMM
jgi:hypothetical protein